MRGIFFQATMTQTTIPALSRTIQTSDGRTLTLRVSSAADWYGQWPIQRSGDLLVSEYPGTWEGSVFVYWLCGAAIESPKVIESIQQHVSDHDVVAIHVVLAFPGYVHSSLKDDLAELKAAASERSTIASAARLPDPSDAKREAIAIADAYLHNACLPTYTKLSDALRWKPIETAPKERYILGRDPHMKRPFVMLWNVPGQRFEASAGFGDETPTQWMDLPTG